jgi:hypothetical protein
MKNKLPFGTMLRAARLRFEYVDRLDCFIRISDKGAHFLVELRPNNVRLLNDGGKGKLYRNLSDPEKVIAMSPVLMKISAVNEPVDLLLDNSGEIVKG